jgi:uncharacterized protein
MSLTAKLADYLYRPSKLGRVGPLELLVLQSTPFCNLDCSYCYLPNRRSTKRMSTEVLEATIKEVFASGIVDQRFCVLWHAGEPLAPGVGYYRKAIEIIERHIPAGKRATYSVQTNATLITDEWCALFKEKGFDVGVSIDGPEAIHDANRRGRDKKGTFHKTMKGIELLKKHRIPFTTISVLTREALGHPDEMFRFFYQLGTRRACFNVEEKEGANLASSLEMADTQELLRRFYSRLYELNAAAPRRLPIREINRYEGAVLGWTPERVAEQSFRGTQENAPLRILSVDWEGNFSTYSPELLGMDVKPYGPFIMGNMLGKDGRPSRIEDALKSAAFRAVARDIQKGIRECAATCAYFSICGGGAPANKYYENGSFASTRTMHCTLQVRTIAETVMGKLEEARPAPLRERASGGGE